MTTTCTRRDIDLYFHFNDLDCLPSGRGAHTQLDSPKLTSTNKSRTGATAIDNDYLTLGQLSRDHDNKGES